MNREVGAVERRQAGGEAGSPGMVAIFGLPAFLREVETVLQPPVIADMAQKVRGGDAVGIEP